MKEQTIILANKTSCAKVVHRPVRGPSRYDTVGVVDAECAGQDAGSLLGGVARNIRDLVYGTTPYKFSR